MSVCLGRLRAFWLYIKYNLISFRVSCVCINEEMYRCKYIFIGYIYLHTYVYNIEEKQLNKESNTGEANKVRISADRVIIYRVVYIKPLVSRELPPGLCECGHHTIPRNRLLSRCKRLPQSTINVLLIV